MCHKASKLWYLLCTENVTKSFLTSDTGLYTTAQRPSLHIVHPHNVVHKVIKADLRYSYEDEDCIISVDQS